MILSSPPALPRSLRMFSLHISSFHSIYSSTHFLFDHFLWHHTKPQKPLWCAITNTGCLSQGCGFSGALLVLPAKSSLGSRLWIAFRSAAHPFPWSSSCTGCVPLMAEQRAHLKLPPKKHLLTLHELQPNIKVLEIYTPTWYHARSHNKVEQRTLIQSKIESAQNLVDFAAAINPLALNLHLLRHI